MEKTCPALHCLLNPTRARHLARGTTLHHLRPAVQKPDAKTDALYGISSAPLPPADWPVCMSSVLQRVESHFMGGHLPLQVRGSTCLSSDSRSLRMAAWPRQKAHHLDRVSPYLCFSWNTRLEIPIRASCGSSIFNCLGKFGDNCRLEKSSSLEESPREAANRCAFRKTAALATDSSLHRKGSRNGARLAVLCSSGEAWRKCVGRNSMDVRCAVGTWSSRLLVGVGTMKEGATRPLLRQHRVPL